jgi:hypothetical protein
MPQQQLRVDTQHFGQVPLGFADVFIRLWHRNGRHRRDADEFIRRFLLHVLPDGFQRIRHYGLLGNRAREGKLALCRQLLDAPPPPPPVLAALADPHDRYEALTGRSLRICPVCAVGIMQRIGIIPATVGRARPVFRADTS